jgi:small-conductance mechanosensitive channel
MAVIHLAGAIVSFLFGGFFLIFSVDTLRHCLVDDWSDYGSCSYDYIGEGMIRFAIGIGLLLFGTWIAYKSRN